MIYIYLLIGYIVSVIAVLLYRTVIASYAFEHKDDRKEQLYHDVIISIIWLPALCIYGTLGLWYAIKMVFK